MQKNLSLANITPPYPLLIFLQATKQEDRSKVGKLAGEFLPDSLAPPTRILPGLFHLFLLSREKANVHNNLVCYGGRETTPARPKADVAISRTKEGKQRMCSCLFCFVLFELRSIENVTYSI